MVSVFDFLQALDSRGSGDLQICQLGRIVPDPRLAGGSITAARAGTPGVTRIVTAEILKQQHVSLGTFITPISNGTVELTIFKTMLISAKCLLTLHELVPNSAWGVPQPFGLGVLLVMSSGMPPRGKCHTLRVVDDQSMAYTPPPIALKLSP